MLFFKVIFFENSQECKSDLIQIRPNVQINIGPDLGQSYMQRSSADDIKVGKSEELTFLFLGHSVYVPKKRKVRSR